MPVDTSIYSNLLARPKSAAEYASDYQAIQANQTNNALARMKMDEYRRGVQEQQTLRNLLSGGADPAALRKGGFLKLANDWEESQAKTAKDQADTKKTQAETIAKHLDTLGTLSRSVMANPTPQSAQSALSQWEQYTGQVDNNERAAVAQLQTPQQVMAWARAHALKADDLKAQVFTNNTGGKTVTQAYDPLKGSVSTLGTIQNTVSPGDVLSAETQRRGQNMVDARAREQIAQGGKAPPGYRYKPDGTMEAIPGGPADAKAQAAAQLKANGATDVDVAIGTLRDAYDRLEKGGGITSTKNGPMGNLSAWSSSSALGQTVGKALGTDNQSARNDIAMARPALLAALMKATGMSAKQMDSNAELKLWLSTATDPTLDVESNRRALANIERKYLNTGASGGAAESAHPSEKGGLTPAEQAELDQLRARFRKK